MDIHRKRGRMGVMEENQKNEEERKEGEKVWMDFSLTYILSLNIDL